MVTRPAPPSASSIASIAKRRWPSSARCRAASRAPATLSTPTTEIEASVSPKASATKGSRRSDASEISRSAPSRQNRISPSTTAFRMLQASSSSVAAETSEMPIPLASQTSVIPVIIVRANGSSKKYASGSAVATPMAFTFPALSIRPFGSGPV